MAPPSSIHTHHESNEGQAKDSRTNGFIRIPHWAEIVAKIMSPDHSRGHVNPVRGWKGPSSQQPERGVAEIAAYYKLHGIDLTIPVETT